MTNNEIKHSPEVMSFASMFHYGVLGIEKTESDVRKGVQRVLDSGYILKAMNVELIYAPLVVKLIDNKMPVHTPVSYPLGNLALKKKLRDIELMIQIGVRNSAYCLNYRNILDHCWDQIENEVQSVLKLNKGIIAFEWVIQATLLNDNEIIDVCKSIENGGGTAVKLNSGYGWGTGVEEVALVKHVFNNRLDIHPSGNIKTLAQVEEFLKYGVKEIHSMAVFEIVDEYISRLEKISC